jgi:hypothetical protein
MLIDARHKKETDRWFHFLTRAKRHANAEEGSMALAAGAGTLALYECLPLPAFLVCAVPLALGAALTTGASVNAFKRRLRRRRRNLSREGRSRCGLNG